VTQCATGRSGAAVHSLRDPIVVVMGPPPVHRLFTVSETSIHPTPGEEKRAGAPDALTAAYWRDPVGGRA